MFVWLNLHPIKESEGLETLIQEGFLNLEESCSDIDSDEDKENKDPRQVKELAKRNK